MTGQCEMQMGGGLGAVPGGPQKCAVVVSGRRPPAKAPFAPGTTVLVSDANGDDPKGVRPGLRRSWGILVRRSFEQGPSTGPKRS
jgi:hypothetical protein